MATYLLFVNGRLSHKSDRLTTSSIVHALKFTIGRHEWARLPTDLERLKLVVKTINPNTLKRMSQIKINVLDPSDETISL